MIPKKIMIWMGITCVVALVAVGCMNGGGVPVPPEGQDVPYMVTGGGWINSAACGDDTCKLKATFGFNLHYTPNETGDPTIKGQFQYTDHGGWEDFKKVSFHGVIAEVPPFNPDGTVYEGIYQGSYTPQPKNLGEGGEFKVTVTDNGQFGPSNSDNVKIELIDGVFDGYTNSSKLRGGNIQFHQDEEE